MATRNRRICLVAGAAILVALLAYLGWYSWYRLTTSPLRLALPRGSTEVTDLYEDFGFFSSDYSYYLRAKLPSMKSFTQYCSDWNLTPHTEQRIYSDDTVWLSWDPWLSRHSPEPIAWWKPSPSLSGTFVQQRGDEWVMAKYEDGYLYVRAISH